MKFYHNNFGWSQLLRSRELRNNRTISHNIKSSLWSSFKDCSNMVKENTRCTIGNGALTNFWLDKWLDEPLAKKFKIPEIYHNTLTSKDCDFLQNNCWLITNNIKPSLPSLQTLLDYFLIPCMDMENGNVWIAYDNGHLNMK